MKHFLVILIAALASTAAAAPEDTLTRIRRSGTITLAHRDASVPFSYYDGNAQPTGYSMDLCGKVVEAVKRELNLAKLQVNFQLVTAANRIPLLRNGTIDLECGSTTNTIARQDQVWFSTTIFVTANRFVSKRASRINNIADLRGKTIVSTAGTTNLKQMTDINTAHNIGMSIISANGHAEAFQIMETGRAAAFALDDIILYSLVAQAQRPDDYIISTEALSVEPYGLMLPKGDTAFKKIVDDTIHRLYKSGEINAIYEKWFLRPIPPRNINLNVPMSAQLKQIIAKPTDSGDPNAYR